MNVACKKDMNFEGLTWNAVFELCLSLNFVC